MGIAVRMVCMIGIMSFQLLHGVEKLQVSEEMFIQKAQQLLAENGFRTFHGNLQLPFDISFLFADIKYTGQAIKIIEFCDMYTGRGNNNAYQDKTLKLTCWDLFWHYLAEFNKPLWYFGKQHRAMLKGLSLVGGMNVKTFDSALACKELNGICVINESLSEQKRKQLLKAYPSMLMVNAFTKKFTKKSHCFDLFEKHPELQTAIPRWKLYQKKYTPHLAAQIMQDIPADFYIIKPVHALQSKGIFMTSKQELDAYLKLILQGGKNLNEFEQQNLMFWRKNKDKDFYVQEYVSSKTITVDGHEYDPTMRVAFFLSNHNGFITVHVVSCYWKIPPQPLRLSEQHITRPLGDKYFTGITVDPHDVEQVKKLLIDMLPSIYLKMLAHKTKK